MTTAEVMLDLGIIAMIGGFIVYLFKILWRGRSSYQGATAGSSGETGKKIQGEEEIEEKEIKDIAGAMELLEEAEREFIKEKGKYVCRDPEKVKDRLYKAAAAEQEIIKDANEMRKSGTIKETRQGQIKRHARRMNKWARRLENHLDENEPKKALTILQAIKLGLEQEYVMSVEHKKSLREALKEERAA